VFLAFYVLIASFLAAPGLDYSLGIIQSICYNLLVTQELIDTKTADQKWQLIELHEDMLFQQVNVPSINGSTLISQQAVSADSTASAMSWCQRFLPDSKYCSSLMLCGV
jgi:hypothetical protein